MSAPPPLSDPVPPRLEPSLERRARAWLARPLLQAATSAAVFAVVGLAAASQLWVNWSAAGARASWPALVGVKLLEWVAWAAVVPLVIALDRRLREGGAAWPLAVAVHAAAATVWFSVQNLVPVALSPWADPASAAIPFGERYLARAVVRMSTAWVVWAAVVATGRALWEFLRRQRLERDLWQAQLRALRAQIQPHFLFNALHTVGSLVRTGDRDQAIGTLVALSELLRRSLDHGRRDEVPLEEELEFLELYVDIQRARFGDRLTVEVDADPDVLDAPVPPLMLQPLVENAIRHGLEPDREPGTVRVRVRGDGRWIRVVVEDDGGALGRDGNGDGGGAGIGLANLRGRLEGIYGRDQSLELTSDGARTAVTVALPRGRA